MTFDLGDEAKKKITEAFGKRGHVNILLAGRSGVGKSTLLNAVFQGNIATTGQGRPVTQDAKEWSKEGVPVSIIDTRGLEMEAYEETLRLLEKEVERRAEKPDPKEHLHVAWVCVSEDSRRVENGEIAIVEMLSRHRIPVVAVITKARADNGFRATVERLLPKARNVIRVRALGETDDEGNVLQPRWLTDLVELTMELVPEAQKNAFVAAQKVSIKLKRSRARAVVVGSASLATAAGASPIPFSDAAVIVPIQVGMLASISAVFGLPFSSAFLSTLIGSAGGGLVATLSGQAIVAGLLKFIPGAGSLVGGAISAGTAAALTTAFGEGYIATLSTLFEQSGGEPPSEEEVAEAFKKQMERTKKEAAA